MAVDTYNIFPFYVSTLAGFLVFTIHAARRFRGIVRAYILFPINDGYCCCRHNPICYFHRVLQRYAAGLYRPIQNCGLIVNIAFNSSYISQ
jgi:hypothetical protein